MKDWIDEGGFKPVGPMVEDSAQSGLSFLTFSARLELTSFTARLRLSAFSREAEVIGLLPRG